MTIACLLCRVQMDLQAILDATMDVVAVFDSERRFVFGQRGRVPRSTSARASELVGARLDDFIGTERAEADWDGFLTPERIAQGMLENVWDGEQDGRRMVLEVRATAGVPARTGTCSSCATSPSGACSRTSCARRRRWRRSGSSRAGSRTTSTTC